MQRDYNGGLLPPRNALLKTRILPLAEYAKEVRRGFKPSKAVCMELFGSTVTPIVVPLKPSESLEQYEARFVACLASMRLTTLTQLRNDPSKERVFRIHFARSEAKEYNERRARALAALDYPEVVAVDSGTATVEPSTVEAVGHKRDQPSGEVMADSSPSKRPALCGDALAHHHQLQDQQPSPTPAAQAPAIEDSLSSESLNSQRPDAASLADVKMEHATPAQRDVNVGDSGFVAGDAASGSWEPFQII